MSVHSSDWLSSFLALFTTHQQAVAAGATPEQAKMATIVQAISIAAAAQTPTAPTTPAAPQ